MSYFTVQTSRLQARAPADCQDQSLVKRLMSSDDFATAVNAQHLQAAAASAVSFFQAISSSPHHSTSHEDASHQSALQMGLARSIESSRQQLHAGRSAEAQMLDSVLSTQPFPGSCTSQSTNQAQPGHQAGAFQGCRPMHSSHHAFHQNFSNDSAASQQSLQDMPASQRQSHLQAGHYAPSQMLIPAPDGTVLAHAAPTGVSPAFLEVPDSLDAIVNGLEGGQLSLLPEATATGSTYPGAGLGMAGSRAMAGSSSLSTGPSAEEQMLAAAAELASFELPLARLAMPTVSEGLANVLQDLRREMLQLEEAIPWTAVRKHWRTKRSSWRRAVRESSSVAAMANCLQDLHAALLVHALPGPPATGRAMLNLGPVWQQSLTSCMEGGEKHAMLLALWNDFKKQVSLWLGAISLRPLAVSMQPSRTKAARALKALLRAETQGAEAVMQVPLDAILNGDSEALETMKAILSQEQLILAARCDRVSQGLHHGDPDSSEHTSMLEAFVCDSEDGFDSGAESVDECSQATDMYESD